MNSKRTTRGAGLIVLLVAIAAVTGAALSISLTRAKAPEELQPEQRVDLLPVALEDFDDGRDVEFVPVVPPPAVVAAPYDGVLTSWNCVPGQPIASGTPVGTIGSLPVIGLHTSAPLWRPLAVGTSGEDVAQVSAELKRLGLIATVPETMDTAVFEALLKLTGLPAQTKEIPAGTFFWLSEPSGIWASCAVGVGAKLSIGQELGATETRPTALKLKVKPAGAAPGDRAIEVGDTSLPMPDAGITDTEALEQLARTDAYLNWRATSGGAAITGKWRLTTPVKAATVPATAIVADGDLICVRDQDAAYPAEVIGSSLGRTLIKFAGNQPERVLAVAPAGAKCR